MLNVIQDHPVCRMPDLHMLYALYKGERTNLCRQWVCNSVTTQSV